MTQETERDYFFWGRKFSYIFGWQTLKWKQRAVGLPHNLPGTMGYSRGG
jgi:hypothetical protein